MKKFVISASFVCLIFSSLFYFTACQKTELTQVEPQTQITTPANDLKASDRNSIPGSKIYARVSFSGEGQVWVNAFSAGFIFNSPGQGSWYFNSFSCGNPAINSQVKAPNNTWIELSSQVLKSSQIIYGSFSMTPNVSCFGAGNAFSNQFGGGNNCITTIELQLRDPLSGAVKGSKTYTFTNLNPVFTFQYRPLYGTFI